MCIPILWLIIGLVVLAGICWALYPIIALYFWAKGTGAPR